MHSSFQTLSIPYNVVLNTPESQPFLRQHPKGFAEAGKKGGSGYFFYVATRLNTLLGIVTICMSIVWASMLLFTESSVRNTYETTSFLTATERTHDATWQVLAQSWSDLSKPNPAVDVQFNHYFECWWAAGVIPTQCANSSVNDYKTCMQAKYSTQLATCVSANDPTDVSPSLNLYTRCINTALGVNRQQLNALTICLRTNMWPLYESPEPVDSWYFLGNYNWAVFLIIGFGLFSCFVFYTGGFVMKAEDMDLKSSGKPKANGPLGYTVTGICIIFAALFFTYFLIADYRLGSVSYGTKYIFPNSVATNTVMVTATLIVLVYFIIELAEMAHTPSLNNFAQLIPFSFHQKLQANNMPHTPGHYGNNRDDEGNYKADGTWKETLTAYYPALTLAWADAYLVDPIITIGLIGSTHQVQTHVLYQLFMALFIYRFAHTAVARFIYEGYIYNPDEKGDKFMKTDGKINSELYAIRMQAMYLHLGSVAAMVMFWVIVANDNIMLSEFQLITMMLWLWYIVPEAIRLISHLIVAFQAIGMPDKYILLGSKYLIWIWDVCVRFIFICIIYWGANNIQGTQAYLDTRLQNITLTLPFTYP